MTKNQGFAMADALVALTIIAAFTSSLMTSNFAMVRGLETSSARLEAALIARALTRSYAIEDIGSIRRGDIDYQWTRRITDRNPQSVLQDVSITVSWPEGQDTHSLTVETVRRGGLHAG
ncbi:MAG: hypothetical protein AAFY34_09815 [Pseudomonadota bacterium]